MGTFPIQSITGEKYFLLFIDDFSRFSWLYLRDSKDETFPIFLKYQKMIETQFESKIKCMQIDCGGEYRPVFLLSHGFLHRVSSQYTS